MLPDAPDTNTMLLLGEIRGQLRELIHTGNNNTMKLDALGTRVMALENDSARRVGANGVVSAILRSPAVGWMVGGATFLWGILTGRIHL